jgi:beta-galactosidase
VSQGKRKKEPQNLLNRHRLVWDGVEYQPGELRAVAYDTEGKVAKECVVRTAGPAAAIRLTADRDSVTADGKEMAFVTVDILDAAGELVPRADDAVTFTMDGPMDIVAVGNGDSTNTTPFASHTRNVFNGKCVAYLRSRPDQPGIATLQATAKGLEAASIKLTSG